MTRVDLEEDSGDLGLVGIELEAIGHSGYLGDLNLEDIRGLELLHGMKLDLRDRGRFLHDGPGHSHLGCLEGHLIKLELLEFGRLPLINLGWHSQWQPDPRGIRSSLGQLGALT